MPITRNTPELLTAARQAEACIDNAADLLRRAVEGELEDYERPEAIEHAEWLTEHASVLRSATAKALGH